MTGCARNCGWTTKRPSRSNHTNAATYAVFTVVKNSTA
jgi:hypothetical protein